MAITITNVQRHSGATCQHVAITVNDEGTTRVVNSSFDEIDSFLRDRFESTAEMKMALVLLWARYRRLRGRQILNVDIA